MVHGIDPKRLLTSISLLKDSALNEFERTMNEQSVTKIFLCMLSLALATTYLSQVYFLSLNCNQNPFYIIDTEISSRKKDYVKMIRKMD